jgi:hypothetical protein
MTDADLAAAWVTAEEALPPGWRLIALLHSDLAQMAVGLHPALEEDLRTVGRPHDRRVGRARCRCRLRLDRGNRGRSAQRAAEPRDPAARANGMS